MYNMYIVHKSDGITYNGHYEEALWILITSMKENICLRKSHYTEYSHCYLCIVYQLINKRYKYIMYSLSIHPTIYAKSFKPVNSSGHGNSLFLPPGHVDTVLS